MVKSLKFCTKLVKLSLLLAVLIILGLGIWLHGGERSLEFAKPWITAAVNTPDAPYVVTIGKVTVDWQDVSKLGQMRITNVTVSKRDGAIFAQLPELYATVDPIGFLPARHLLHRVILRQPKMSMTRSVEGVLEFGIEGASSRMALTELTDFFSGDPSRSAPGKTPSLPFHDFTIQGAALTFTDANSQTNIESKPFDMRLRRRHGTYEASLSMPFTVNDERVMVGARLRTPPDRNEPVLSVEMHQMPSKLLCLFGACPEDVKIDGTLDGAIAISFGKDFAIHGFGAELTTSNLLLDAPHWFAEPLKLGKSKVKLVGDWEKHEVALTEAVLALEDTNITASGKANRDEKGWYVTGDGSCTQLDIKKLYKYWPLFMAPDSRNWVTSKLKSGYAAKGTIKINFKPEDFEQEFFPDASVDAIADARDITFEYLPGFPLVEKMNGIAHFTGTTVKVEGSGGTLMTGTTISHAVLWCPELNTPSNPMEATVTLTAPAADAATMLALKHFPFDDQFGLDPQTIRGTVDADMKLKFNAFSDKPNADPNEIHLEAVDYNIATNLRDVAQEKIYDGYHVKAINGALKASNAGLDFDGSVLVGDAPLNDIKLSQMEGKPLSVQVKGRPGKDGKTVNDFSLVYQSTKAGPNITVRGKRLDASVSYGSKENSLLKDFPAMKLDINLGELVLAKAASFRDVVGKLSCSAARCESADFSAKTGKTELTASINSDSGVREFMLDADDAGSVLKAFDISDRMTRGKLDMHGTFDDKKTPPQLNARLSITDFTLQNSEILGRILSIGSLTGLSNALTGSGISFNKMVADINSRAGVITVSKGIANGTSLGITVAGTVDTNTTRLGLKGTLAPAYALNSIFSKIPLLGALAGGDAGLIAFNYSVNGTYEKPEVGVNPLSGLTPGFLRGIFGVFDEKPEDEDEPAQSKAGRSSNVHKH